MQLRTRGFFCTALFFFTFLSATAQEIVDQYQIKVPVDVQSTSATAAKKRAVAEGLKLSFKTLLGRLTPVRYHDALLQKGEELISSLLLNHSFSSERFSSTRYRADILYHYDQDKLHHLLQTNGIPYLDRMIPRFVVLPFIQKEGGALTFYGDALDSLRQVEKVYPAFDFMLPLDDLEDHKMFQAFQTLSNKNLFEGYAARYGVSAVLIVIFNVKEDPLNPTNIFLEKILIKPFGILDMRSFVYELTALDHLNEVTTTHHLMEIFKVLMNNWFSDHLLKDLTPDVYRYQFSIQGLKHMRTLLHQLDRLPRVQRVALEGVKRNSVTVSLSYLGGNLTLEEALKKHHISFEPILSV